MCCLLCSDTNACFAEREGLQFMFKLICNIVHKLASYIIVHCRIQMYTSIIDYTKQIAAINLAVIMFLFIWMSITVVCHFM